MQIEVLEQRLRAFLVAKRDAAGLSQSDVAARSEVFGMGRQLDQRSVSRIEQAPMSSDALKIAAYMTAVGCTPPDYFEELSRLTAQQETAPNITMTPNSRIHDKLAHAHARLNQAESIIDGAQDTYIGSLQLGEKFARSRALLDGLQRKPVIGCFGHFDAGKSTLLNTIISESVLPTKYQPATSVVNLLMHTAERPTTLVGSVAVFRKGFMPHMIHDATLVAQYLIEQGDGDLLRRYGMHQHDSELAQDAYVAVVFSDADILKHVWLLDTPGQLGDGDDSDTEKALAGVELTDGIVFMSNHTGFLKDSDLGFAANVIRARVPVTRNDSLGHLLFVQSHCHGEIPAADVDAVALSAFRRVKRQLDNMIFAAWMEDKHIDVLPSADQLAARVQPFWRENDLYRNATLRRIRDMAAMLTASHESIVDQRVEQTMEQLVAALQAAVDQLAFRKEDTIKRVKEVEDQEARFRLDASELVAQFQALITSCSQRKQQDLETIGNYYRVQASADSIEKLIHDTYTDKKEAQGEVVNYLTQLFTSKLESVLKTSGRSISEEVDNLLQRWQAAAPAMAAAATSGAASGLEVNLGAFNSRAAFIGGMAGLGSLGAMSLYVGTIASNLGAYILVGKAAGVLASLGLVGSVTSVTSFVAAIGGPITIGIAIAAAIGYMFYRLLGGSWQKSLANKVAEGLHENKLLARLEEPVTAFWTNTEQAMRAGVSELVVQTDEHIENLRRDATTAYDATRLEQSVATVRAAIALMGVGQTGLAA